MKRKLLLTACIIGLSTIYLSARQLTPDEALSRLTPTEMNRIKAAMPHAQLQLKATGHDAAGNAAYYIFSAGDRTLFASADDVAAPLLGYVISSDFNVDDMPPAMSWWLGEYAREIAWATANGVKAFTSTRASDTKVPIAPLVKTTWNQGAPYNDLCPQKNGQITYTGCVATSTAQVMNYHQWPPKGIGTVSYDWNGQPLSMDLGATTFAWNDMLDSYPTATTGTDAQRQAVATLMKACGYALHMTYGLSADGGSGAYSSDIADALINNFSYDVTARYVQREFYSPEEWEQMIYDNLADIGPAIYGGHGSLGGHSFICDGYDTDGLFHINWGWGGTSDGYFRLSALDPPSLGAGGGAGGFNSQQNATLGIRKPQPGSVRPLPYIVCGGAERIYATVVVRTISVTPNNHMPPCLFKNAGSSTGVFSFGLKVVNENTANEVIMVPSDNVKDETMAPGFGKSEITVTLPDDIADGTYMAYPVYKLGDNPWESIRLPYGAINYIRFSIKDGTVSIDRKSSPSNVFIESLECPTGLIVEKPYTINFTAFNNQPKAAEYRLIASLLEEDTHWWCGDLGRVSATLNPDEPTPLSISGTLDNTVKAGRYILSIEDENSGNISYSCPVTVTEYSGRDETAEDASDAHSARWYDLSGRPVEPTNLPQGIYIRTDGIHTDKVMVK